MWTRTRRSGVARRWMTATTLRRMGRRGRMRQRPRLRVDPLIALLPVASQLTYVPVVPFVPSVPALFMFPMLGIGLGVGVVVGTLWSSFLTGMVTGYLSLFVGMAISDRVVGVYVRSKYPERAKEVHRNRVCPKCNSRRATTRGTVTCPVCHQRTMKIRIWGVS